MTESSKQMRALAGIRVLDAATYIAAPFAATMLAEFGAEVIKIEQPGQGDTLRSLGTPSKGSDTLFWLNDARNKRSVTLDLRHPKGALLFKRLAAEADVVCENFRPGTMAKWGLGYEDLKAVNPRLIVHSVSGYGQTGPYSERPAFARIAHAFGGLAYLTGMPGGPPLTPGSTSLADYISGLYGAFGILVALRARDATGRGQHIDLALYESIFRVLDDIAPTYAATGKVRDRCGLMTANACPHGHFQASDGEWLAIACTNDKMFGRLAEAMGQPDLAAPDAFGRHATRLERHEEVDRIVAAWVKSMTRDEAVETCLEGDVPCAPVNSIADIFADPHFKARENLVPLEHPEIGELTVPNVIPRLSETPGSVTSLGPSLGEANRDVYCGLLGLSDAELSALEEEGVV